MIQCIFKDYKKQRLMKSIEIYTPYTLYIYIYLYTIYSIFVAYIYIYIYGVCVHVHNVHICVSVCIHTHTHTSSHGWYVERVAFKSLTEGMSEPLRTAQITPKALESFGVIVWHRNDGIFCTLFFCLLGNCS